jgi:hypothetical protein
MNGSGRQFTNVVWFDLANVHDNFVVSRIGVVVNFVVQASCLLAEAAETAAPQLR